MHLRCSSRIHAVLVDGHFEIKCSSKRCGATRGVVVLHYFDPFTGDLVRTRKFQDPDQQSKNEEQ